MSRRIRRVLARAVQVPNGADGPLCVQPIDQRRRQSFAGQRDRVNGRRQLASSEQLAQSGRDAVDERDLMAKSRVAEGEHVLDEHHPPPERQRHQDLEHGQVEAQRGRRSIPSRSSSVNVASAHAVSCATEPCSTITPFGIPVEPDVKSGARGHSARLRAEHSVARASCRGVGQEQLAVPEIGKRVERL